MKLIRLNEVQALTGLGRSTVYKYISQGTFPCSVKLGGRSSAWVEAEVKAWIAERICERDQQMAVAVSVV